jgi:hypothetical protein
MSLDVYEVATVLKPSKYQISSVSVTRTKVYVGSDEGSLHVFDIVDNTTGRPALEPITTSDGIIQRFSGIARRPVRNLIAIPEWNMLISIAGPMLPPSSVPIYEGINGSNTLLSTPMTRNRLGVSTSTTSTSSSSHQHLLYRIQQIMQVMVHFFML